MSRGFSIYLDALRVAAAFVVLLSHFAYPWASGGGLLWIRELNLGSDAVVLFFVLSGLVIAHTTTVKDNTLGQYALARMSRLYSVAIPALLLSFACASLGHLINPERFDALLWTEAAEQAIRGLTFTNYVWWDSQRIAFNGPYWSVSYEFWYYVLFGVAFYLRGRARLWSLVLISLFLGPKILLLAPCWLAGVLIYRALKSGVSQRSTGELWRLTLGPWLIYALLLAIDMPLRLTVFTWQVFGQIHPNTLFGFSDEFIWNTVLAALFSAHFIGVAGLLRNGSSILESAAGVTKWISGRTFSLYLFHMPLLKLGSGLPGFDAANVAHSTSLLVVTIAACLLLAEATERRLTEWRSFCSLVARCCTRAITSLSPGFARQP